MTITLSRRHIYKTVKSTVLYRAAKSTDATPQSFDKATIIDEDLPMLDTIFNQAVADVLNVLRAAVSDVNITTARLILRLRRYAIDHHISLPMLERDIELHITHSMIARWLELSGNTDSDVYSSLSDEDAARLRNHFLSPSTRKTYWL